MDLALKLQLKLSQAQIQRLEMLAYNADDMMGMIKTEEERNPFLSVSYNSSYSMDKRGEIYVYDDRNNDDGDKAYWADRLLEQKETLIEHIEKQVEMLDISEREKDAVLRIASSLDDKGFLTTRPENLFQRHSREEIDKALETLRTLDPTGIGAEDVPGSLKIQIGELDILPEDRKKLSFLADNLEMIRGGKTEKAALSLKTDEEDIKALIAVLKTLSPYPAIKYGVGFEKYIRPEISIKKNEEGEIIAEYDDSVLPECTLSEEYLELEKELGKEADEKTKSFIKENKASAEKIVEALELRKRSLILLSTYIMSHQKNFFQSGPMYLVPDTQSNAAEVLELSPSTISRLCSGKYVDTDWGVLPLSYFFSSASGFEKKDENAISKNAIKEHIRKIIEENNTGKALSDQKISNKLAEMGIKVARRTVAKYRGEMALDTSYNRN